MTKPEFDICVIGGGAGGLVAAAGAATLGAKVALVEKKALGGDCLHYGCVPSKALIHCAKVAQTMKTANHFGVPANNPPIKIVRIMQRVKQVIDTIAVHDSPDRFTAMGIDVIFGDGQFQSPKEFKINNRTLTAKNFVIATGSSPTVPDIEGLSSLPFHTNESIFYVKEDIKSLIVLGAGPIGLELAQSFSRLGSEVHVVQRGNRILPKEDEDLANIIRQKLEGEKITFHQNNELVRFEKKENIIRLTLKPKNGDREIHVEASHVLVATGRQANTKGLGLDAAGVKITKGYVQTDLRLRTNVKNIYACGDVIGSHQFTHMAEHYAGVVLRNALFHLPAKIEQTAIPWCTFTDPEVARVGLSEEEAQSIEHKVYTFPFKDIDRAQAEGETDGLAKIITNPKGQILGAAIVGPNAGDIIHEYTLAISKKMKASDISKVIHIYPTLAQINRRVADARMKEGLTPTSKKWIKRIFGLRG